MINLMELGADAVAKAASDATEGARVTALERLADEIDADYGHQYADDYLDEVRDGWG